MLDLPLEAAWNKTARTVGLSKAQAHSIFADLCGRYCEPTRHYHTLHHVAAMLKTIGPFREQCEDTTLLELAIWFHDAVYDARLGDNEAESAALANAALTAVGVSAAACGRVQRLILATKTHWADAADRDCRLLLDTDLAIFGASSDNYDAYAAAVRREYEWVEEPDFRAGRARVLQGFLDRDRIFQTDSLGALEQPARANLNREREGLCR